MKGPRVRDRQVADRALRKLLVEGQYVSRRVDDAREKAGVPDMGEGGRTRKPTGPAANRLTGGGTGG